MSTDTLSSLQYLVQSKKTHEKQDGFKKLTSILKKTQAHNRSIKTDDMSTISNQLYKAITQVVFDQNFSDLEVRQCLLAARNSWLLNDVHREKLNSIS